jgi:hypothetical protein
VCGAPEAEQPLPSGRARDVDLEEEPTVLGERLPTGEDLVLQVGASSFVEAVRGLGERRAVDVLPEEVLGTRHAEHHALRVRQHVRETGGLQQHADLCRLVEGEDGRDEPSGFGADVASQGLLEHGEERWNGSGDVEDGTATGREDTPHLVQRARPVGEELRAHLTEHDVEGRIS